MMPAKLDRKAARLRAALERRYPGVTVHVDFIVHVAAGYKGWRVVFEALDPHTLINFRLASGLSDFADSDSAGSTEFVGCSRYFFGICDASKLYRAGYHIEEEPDAGYNRALTKKMQTQVMRLLKPFIKGTWKLPAARP
jgi:hypothetical protein